MLDSMKLPRVDVTPGSVCVLRHACSLQCGGAEWWYDTGADTI